MKTFNCVYYWVGGTEEGKWRQADAGTCEKCRRMGYVAHNGNTKIGPPDGPPSEAELKSVLSFYG